MQKRKSLGGKKKKVGTIDVDYNYHKVRIMKILILHGWSYSAKGVDPLEKWNHFIDQLKSKDYKPTLLKIPGLSKNLKEVWNLEKYVEWLKELVKNEKVILVGHSNGGRISLAFSLKYPEKVEHLILIDSAGIYHNELPLRIKRFLFKNIAKLGKKITSSKALKTLLYKLAREGDYKNASPAQRQTMLNLINTDLAKIFSKIKVPTLIIWGKQDKVTPLSDGILMHKLIKDSQLKVIDKAQHSPQFTHPKEVIKIINEYL